MKEKIIDYLKNPYLSLNDSIVMLPIMILSCSLVTLYFPISTVFAIVAISTITAILCAITSAFHYYTFSGRKRILIREILYTFTPAEILSIIIIASFNHLILKRLTQISLTIAVIYLICFFIISFKKKIKKKNIVIGIHLIFSICFLPALIYLAGIALSKSPIMVAPKSDISEQIYLKNEPIAKIEWDNMNYENKLSYLTQIVGSEASCLGMNTIPEINVVVHKGIVGAEYSPDFDIIFLNATKLSDPQIISYCLHELYHRYQYNITLDESSNFTGVDSERINQYKKEFSKSNKRKSIISYYNQQIEIDARNYENTAEKYFTET